MRMLHGGALWGALTKAELAEHLHTELALSKREAKSDGRGVLLKKSAPVCAKNEQVKTVGLWQL